MDDFNVQNTNNDNEGIQNDRRMYVGNEEVSGSASLKEASFYTESCKKTNKKNNGMLFQLVTVALVSSMIGGGVVAAAFQFVPAVQPSVKGYMGNLIPGDKSKQAAANNNAKGELKKVDLQQGAASGDASIITAIADKVSPSIVGIKTSFKTQGFFFDDQQSNQAEGSGIVIKSDGYIMTNYHVIGEALDRNGKISNGAKIEVILPNKIDKPYAAQVIGGDSKTDLAVIKIDIDGLQPVEFGNSDTLKVGELAVAIGNPAGLEYMGSVTSGIISGLNRTISASTNGSSGNEKDLKLIQTDAAINPGNSGGALLNAKGQVIGVNTAKIGGSGFEGLGFAIPINKAKEITDSLIQYKYVKGRPSIGISVDPRFDEQVAQENNVPNGVLVADVSPLSGAYKAGIKAGDIVTKFDGQKIKSLDELNVLKNKHKPGDIVSVEIYRDNQTLTVQVKLSEDKGK